MGTPSATPRLTPGLLTVLGLLATASALSTDIYLPSLTSIAADLEASPSLVQLTLSLFFFGIGTGQLVLGPLSDLLGRRPVLITGLVVFALSSLGTVFAPNIELLIALRLVQGFSGAAGIVLGRAIAADLSTGKTAVRALSLMAMVSGLAPLIAPVIGGVTHELWGWRGTLATLSTFAFTLLVLGWLRVPESLPPERRGTSGFRGTFHAFGTLMRDGQFVVYSLAFGTAFMAAMAYIAASPFVGQRLLGMSPLVYAIGFGASASALVLANTLNARIAPRVGPARMLVIGVTLLTASSLAMLLFVLTAALTPLSFIVCAFFLTAGTGLTMANTSALALARAGAARGSGSAVMGSAQFLLGGITAPLVGAWGEHTALPMVLISLTGALIAALCALTAVRMGRQR